MLLTIQTAGEVLDLFSADVPEVGVTETACRLELSKSKAHELLSSLASVGLLSRTERGRYRVGWRGLRLARVFYETTPLVAKLRPAMNLIADRVGDSVHLAMLKGDRAVCIGLARGSSSSAVTIGGPGVEVPLHTSAVGKVLLANEPDERLEGLIEVHGLPRSTRWSITSPGQFMDELAEVRELGFAHDRGETLLGTSCVAVPVEFDQGRVSAALSISAPTSRIGRNETLFRRMLNRTSCEVRQAGTEPACA